MKRLRAFCLIRLQPHYRHDAFERGLARAGYDVHHGQPFNTAPGEVLVIWNRYGDVEQIADRFEAAGGIVLVAENGYLAPGGGTPKHDVRAGVSGKTMFALARSKHNGGGDWPRGGAERWQALGIELKPWREQGEHILVAPNRSFGTRGNIMPLTWSDDVVRRLKKVTDRPIRVRPHPGNFDSRTLLAKDLHNAHAVVIWASSVGVHALVAGIPVISEAAWWICKKATINSIGGLDWYAKQWALPTRLREQALHELAWAQWTLEEIESGEPFKLLCTLTPAATSTA